MKGNSKPFEFLITFFAIIFMIFPMMFLGIPFGTGVKSILFSGASVIVGTGIIIILSFLYKKIRTVSWKTVAITCLIFSFGYFSLAYFMKKQNQQNVSTEESYFKNIKGKWKCEIDNNTNMTLEFISQDEFIIKVANLQEDTIGYDYYTCNYIFIDNKLYGVDSTENYELYINIIDNNILMIENDPENLFFHKIQP